MKSIISFVNIMTCTFMMTGCAITQDAGGSGSKSDRISGNEIQNLLVGTWKITSIHCDSRGANCDAYKATRFFTYGKDGKFYVNDEERGSYRVTGKKCMLDTGRNKYTVNIIQISATKLITGESHRTTTEIFTRMN